MDVLKIAKTKVRQTTEAMKRLNIDFPYSFELNGMMNDGIGGLFNYGELFKYSTYLMKSKFLSLMNQQNII